MEAFSKSVIVAEILKLEHRLRAAGFKPTEVLLSVEAYEEVEREIGQPAPHSLSKINGMPISLDARDGWAIAVEP